MRIGEKLLGQFYPTYIVAEAGTSHAGSCDAALHMTELAATRGADAIKFQAFVPEEPLFCPWPGDGDRMERWGESALTLAEWSVVKSAADVHGIDLLLSAFQPIVVSWVKTLDLLAYKVASRAAMKFPYEAVPGPFIISTGTMRPEHWRTVQDRMAAKGRIFLQCKMDYPHDPMPWSAFYGGLSDHSGTIWPAVDAIVRGAGLIEVHVGFGDQNANDEAVSITPEELGFLCEARDVFAVMRPG